MFTAIEFFSEKDTNDLTIDTWMYLQVNVTADHRIIYGADLAAFLKTFAKIIQDPDSLTL